MEEFISHGKKSIIPVESYNFYIALSSLLTTNYVGIKCVPRLQVGDLPVNISVFRRCLVKRFFKGLTEITNITKSNPVTYLR